MEKSTENKESNIKKVPDLNSPDPYENEPTSKDQSRGDKETKS